MRTFSYITVGRILKELEDEGLKISRSTLLRRTSVLNLPVGKRKSGKIQWRVYSPEESAALKNAIKLDFNFISE